MIASVNSSSNGSPRRSCCLRSPLDQPAPERVWVFPNHALQQYITPAGDKATINHKAKRPGSHRSRQSPTGPETASAWSSGLSVSQRHQGRLRSRPRAPGPPTIRPLVAIAWRSCQTWYKSMVAMKISRCLIGAISEFVVERANQRSERVGRQHSEYAKRSPRSQGVPVQQDGPRA